MIAQKTKGCDLRTNLWPYTTIFFMLTALLYIKPIYNYNGFVFLNAWLNQDIKSVIWGYITNLGNATVLFPISMVLFRKNTFKQKILLFATIFCFITVYGIKRIINAPRPMEVIPDLHSIGPKLYHFSFVSGHTATFFLLVGLIYLLFESKLFFYIIFGMGLLVGLSRIALGVHWPIDITGGITIGLLCVQFAVYVVINNKNQQWIKWCYIFLGLCCAIYLFLTKDSHFGFLPYIDEFRKITAWWILLLVSYESQFLIKGNLSR